MAALECQNCGAVVRNQGTRFCEFCGTELLHDNAPRTPTPEEARRTRFELLREHHDLDRWMRHTPVVPSALPLGLTLFTIPFFAVFLSGLVLFMWFSSRMGAPLIFQIVPVIMMVAVVAGISGMGRRVSRYRNAPLARRPAIIVDERTRVSGGGNNSSASTSYYATLEFDDGTREECRVDARTAGRVTEGDVGVAYTKHDVLIEFRRLSV